MMVEDQETALDTIINSLQTMQVIHKKNPSSLPIRNFNEAKQKEIIDLYQNATTSQKEIVKAIMCNIDITNCNNYTLKLQ